MKRRVLVLLAVLALVLAASFAAVGGRFVAAHPTVFVGDGISWGDGTDGWNDGQRMCPVEGCYS